MLGASADGGGQEAEKCVCLCVCERKCERMLGDGEARKSFSFPL